MPMPAAAPTLESGPARMAGRAVSDEVGVPMIQRPWSTLIVMAAGALAGLVWLLLPTAAYADTSTVTTTADSGPGSLRAAIVAANAHPNASFSAGDTDRIAFGIPPALCNLALPACTITLDDVLPPITDPVVVDGWTEGGPGYD